MVSSRRTYGQLIARYPNAIEFFPQDREMLSLYAKHAAAVLDMALALQESAHRHEQVSSLLALSHALAEGRHEPGGRRAPRGGGPEVVDCDRMAVWLWDEHERCLRSTGVVGTDDPRWQRRCGELPSHPRTPHTCRACSPSLGRISSTREPTTCSSAS